MAKTFTHPDSSELCYLTRDAGGAAVAFNRRCTHAACTVEPSPSGPRLICPCHGSEFVRDTGAVVVGPANQPLHTIDVAESDGQVRVI